MLERNSSSRTALARFFELAVMPPPLTFTCAPRPFWFGKKMATFSAASRSLCLRGRLAEGAAHAVCFRAENDDAAVLESGLRKRLAPARGGSEDSQIAQP